eukprot:4619765-Pyramimonas_sp.AAC.1
MGRLGAIPGASERLFQRLGALLNRLGSLLGCSMGRRGALNPPLWCVRPGHGCVRAGRENGSRCQFGVSGEGWRGGEEFH